MASADLAFGRLRIARSPARATYDGTSLPLTPKPLAVLSALAERPGQPLTHDALMQAAWPGVNVTPGTVAQTVFVVRKALRDAGSTHEWIVTVPHGGYRFVPEPERNALPAIHPRSDRTRWMATAATAVIGVLLSSGARDLRSTAPGFPAAPRSASAVSLPATAQGAYRTGRAELERGSIPSLTRATTSLRRAVVADPAFADAYAALASAYAGLGAHSAISRRDAARMASDAAYKALGLDATLVEAHTMLAFVQHNWQLRWSDAEAHYRTALALDDAYAPAHHFYGVLLAARGRIVAAEAHLRAAVRLSPANADVVADLGVVLGRAGRLAEARTAFALGTRLAQDDTAIQRKAGWVLAAAGHHADAEAAFTAAGAPSSAPGPHVLAGLGYVYARTGRAADAWTVLEQLRRTRLPDHGVRDALIARVLIGLGRRDDALDLLERAHPDGDPDLAADAIYSRLRPDPRFVRLLCRSGLEPAMVAPPSRRVRGHECRNPPLEIGPAPVGPDPVVARLHQ